MRCVMKLNYTFLLLFLSLMNSVHVFAAEDVQVDMQDVEDRLIYAIDHNNKAKILGYIKQDPSLLFSLINSDEFLKNPDKTIRMFTTFKKSGVNLNCKDEHGDSVLHAVVEVYFETVFGIPVIAMLISNIARACSGSFTGQENDDKDDKKNPFLSESEFVAVTKNTQKIIQGLLKLGVKKNLKNHDNETAADVLKSYIDEMKSEIGSYKKAFVKLNKLYKMVQ